MNLKRGMGLKNLHSKKAQVTIFVIIAVIIVAAVGIYFLVRNVTPLATAQVPQDFQPVYNSFLSCVESNAQTGISVLESQGGYIYLPSFQPGSTYQPFSSDLVFLGNPIPYWYYLSANNLPKSQVPNETLMQNQLAQFIDSKIRNCYLANYTDFQITEGTPQASVQIKSDSVQVNLNMDLTLRNGNQSVTIKNHKVTVNSELGNLFQSAEKVYDYELSNQFLENYTVDALRSYAPVSGVDVKCSPVTWSAASVFTELKSAITDNIMSLRTGENKTNYFTLPLNVPGVSFITSPSWPSDYEVSPTQGDAMIAQPVGNQESLGILGFCYVPYHFVYSVKYPVLVAVKSGNEIFQFPMAVVIENNMPLGASNNGTATEIQQNTLCSQGKTNITVGVFDSNSNPVDANVSYECLGQTCEVGQSVGGSINGEFPQCVNGYIIASAPGFKTGRYLFSTVQGGSINVILGKQYSENVNLNVGGNPYSGSAIINFISSDGSSQTLIYPNQKTVNLSEGNYNISAYVYENSSLTVGATQTQQCVNIAGTGGQQQCFTVNIPSSIVSTALAGGGQAEYYIFSSELADSSEININAPSLPAPTSLEQLQNNYISIGSKNLTISFS